MTQVQLYVLTLSAIALAWLWLDPAPSLRVMDMLVLGHLLLGAGTLAVWGLRRGAHPLAAVLAALVFAFGGAAMGRLQHTLLVLTYAWLPIVMLAVEALLEHPGPDPLARWLTARMAAAAGSGGPMRAEILGLGGSWQNAGLSLGVDTALGYNPLRGACYDTAVGAAGNSHLPRRPFGTLMTGYAAPFADLLGIRYIVFGAPMDEIDPASVTAFPPPLRIGDAYIYENADAVPRLVLVAADNVRPHDPDTVLETGEMAAFDPAHEALIEGAVAPENDTAPAAFNGTLRVIDHGPDRVRVAIDTDRAAYVVFHELADPGWAARVDGIRRPLHRANVLFQAVRVDPGAREVTFAYSPWRAVRAALRLPGCGEQARGRPGRSPRSPPWAGHVAFPAFSPRPACASNAPDPFADVQ